MSLWERYIQNPPWNVVDPPSSLDPNFNGYDLALFSDLPYGQIEVGMNPPPPDLNHSY